METETQRYFDLNIQEILDAWLPRHAVREIIANALDEQAITQTKDISIAKNGADWIIRDYGRGLRYEHLIQNENPEKFAHADKVIGMFGIGLKDALATLHRFKINVKIRSAHGDITIIEHSKHGFDQLPTLHAVIHPASDPLLVGTEIMLQGLGDDEMAAAKAFFLRFSGENVLGETNYGQILRRKQDGPAHVCIKGLLVAEEENFIFSYNITSLTTAMRKAMNRERTNVGRTAFADRIKAMLLACTAPTVADVLGMELGKIDEGKACDEVRWTDVAIHAAKILNQSKKVVFVSSEELIHATAEIDRVRSDGLRTIVLPQDIRQKINNVRDASGAPIHSLDVFKQEWADSFKFEFVGEANLSEPERRIFALRNAIAEAVGGWPSAVKEVLVSKVMRPSTDGRTDAKGLWEGSTRRIIIRRDQLQSIAAFSGTLIHEITHAKTGYPDVNVSFELALTDMIGQLGQKVLERKPINSTVQLKTPRGLNKLKLFIQKLVPQAQTKVANCPKCKTPFSFSTSDLTKGKEIVCAGCKSTILISAKN